MTDQYRLLMRLINDATEGKKIKCGESCFIKKDQISGKQLGHLLICNFNEYIIHSDPKNYDYLMIKRCEPKYNREEDYQYK
ncbi:MAG: hypothetical protein IJB92_00025 [Clostridia bacterium]|nr:hypothetical protein [Clostridia bacterium]